MPEPQPSKVELIPHSTSWWLNGDGESETLPSDLAPTKDTARLYWLYHPSRPDAVKIRRPDETEVRYDSYDYAAEQLGVKVSTLPDVAEEAERLLEKVGRKFF